MMRIPVIDRQESIKEADLRGIKTLKKEDGEGLEIDCGWGQES